MFHVCGKRNFNKNITFMINPLYLPGYRSLHVDHHCRESQWNLLRTALFRWSIELWTRILGLHDFRLWWQIDRVTTDEKVRVCGNILFMERKKLCVHLRWRQFWDGAKSLGLPRSDALSPETRLTCDQFRSYHMEKCIVDIVKDRR